MIFFFCDSMFVISLSDHYDQQFSALFFVFISICFSLDTSIVLGTWNVKQNRTRSMFSENRSNALVSFVSIESFGRRIRIEIRSIRWRWRNQTFSRTFERKIWKYSSSNCSKFSFVVFNIVYDANFRYDETRWKIFEINSSSQWSCASWSNVRFFYVTISIVNRFWWKKFVEMEKFTWHWCCRRFSDWSNVESIWKCLRYGNVVDNAVAIEKQRFYSFRRRSLVK